jgi:hypothetical protein
MSRCPNASFDAERDALFDDTADVPVWPGNAASPSASGSRFPTSPTPPPAGDGRAASQALGRRKGDTAGRGRIAPSHIPYQRKHNLNNRPVYWGEDGFEASQRHEVAPFCRSIRYSVCGGEHPSLLRGFISIIAVNVLGCRWAQPRPGYKPGASCG